MSDYLERLYTSTMAFVGKILYVETSIGTVKTTNNTWLVLKFMCAVGMFGEMQFVDFWPLHFLC
jgi:hypothetical protein